MLKLDRMRGRSGMRTGEQVKLVQRLAGMGCAALVSKLDVADAAEAKQLMADARRLAPIGGIFHLAMVLDDRLLINQARP